MNIVSNAHIVEITPLIAQRYLERNAANRPLSNRTVTELSSAIQNDEWQINGEAIKFDEHGNLIDGQHRLNAVIKSNRSIKSYVLKNLPTDSFKTLDTGKKRNNADTLGLLGYGNPTQLAAACTFVVSLRTNQLRTSEHVTNIQMEQFIEEHPAIVDSVHFVRSVGAHSLVPAAVAAGLHFLMSDVDTDDAEIFFRDLAKGSMLSASDPAFLLREKLLFYKHRVGAKLTRREIAAHVIKAWNYRRTGRVVKRLTWAKKMGEEFPIIR